MIGDPTPAGADISPAVCFLLPPFPPFRYPRSLNPPRGGGAQEAHMKGKP
jgi:hypothetical protein